MDQLEDVVSDAAATASNAEPTYAAPVSGPVSLGPTLYTPMALTLARVHVDGGRLEDDTQADDPQHVPRHARSTRAKLTFNMFQRRPTPIAAHVAVKQYRSAEVPVVGQLGVADRAHEPVIFDEVALATLRAAAERHLVIESQAVRDARAIERIRDGQPRCGLRAVACR